MFLTLEEITSAIGEPVSLARAKRHLRAVEFNDDDADIEEMITASRQQAENWLGRPLRAATYRATFDGWSEPFVIARQGPVNVLQIDYLDTAGSRSVVPAGQYQSGHGHQGQVICPANAWPSNSAVSAMPRITFQVGFTNVPTVIKQAILLGVQFMYDNRGSTQFTNQKFEDSHAWQNMLWPYRLLGL